MKLEDRTLKYFIEKCKGPNRYRNIRDHARKLCKPRKQCCEKCGYDKHVEVCHKISISDFELEDTVAKINALDNLVLLCPNCHWEFDNLEKEGLTQKKTKCLCGERKMSASGECQACNRNKPRINSRKVVRPPKEILEKLLYEKPMIKIGADFGVSDNAVRKWCEWYKIEVPKFPMGYWISIEKRMYKRESDNNG